MLLTISIAKSNFNAEKNKMEVLLISCILKIGGRNLQRWERPM